MAALDILIGCESFKKLRECNCCYVDKTSFLVEMLSSPTPSVSLITRPRRFGKTLMLSMLHEFFDIRKKSSKLFEGLAISKNDEICNTWMNQVPTIFLSLKRVEGSDFTAAVRAFRDLAARLCEENKYLLESDKVSQLDREILRRVMLRTADPTELSGFLYNLCYALEAYWGKQAILLIDEYDVPLSYAEQNGYYKQMVCFMRDVLGTALKTNNSLEFAVLTGCLRIAKESIFTGINNFMCYSVSNAKYADKFGFTEDEVDHLLNLSGLNDKKSEFKEWYDGYRFGNGVGIYCPWDILVHIDNLKSDQNLTPQTYWNNTSGNSIVRTLIENSDGTSRQEIERLVSGESIEANIIEDLTYNVVYNEENNIWSMLYLTGYLTKAEQQPSNGNIALVVPNKEINKIFIQSISQWFVDSLKKEDFRPFLQSLWDGDAQTVQDTITRILYETISFYDSAENYYHGFMAGLLRGAGQAVTSNRESGLGRSDIIIVEGWRKRAMIIELKRAQQYERLEAEAKDGLGQIARLNYARGLPPQISRVLKYGIAFWKKECFVAVEESGS